MADTHDILKSNASIVDVEFTPMQKVAACRAMIDYANLKVQEYRSSESKSVNLEAIKLFPALWKGQWKLFLRKRSFLKAKKQAQTLANIENRPFYVIRSTEIAYVVQSTLVARGLKKRGIYSKDATALKLRETADFTATPQK